MLRIHTLILAAVLLGGSAQAQFDGPRTFWPLPKNTNIFALRSGRGQANASLAVWNQVQPGIDIETELHMLTYTRTLPIFGRTAYWQAFLPFVTTDTSSALPLGAVDSFAAGIGDPSIAGTVNIFGKPDMPAREYIRHDHTTSLDLGLMASFPIGEYDEDELLNPGSNQWKARVAAPIIHAIGPWVPGERTTLELTPAIHLLGDNDDARGNSVEQDPLFTLEAHLTRDLTRDAFLSLDYVMLRGGEETLTDKATSTPAGTTSGIDAQLLGFTVGYQINDSMRLSLGHSHTFGSDSGAGELDGSLTMLTLSWSWHSVLESVREFHRD